MKNNRKCKLISLLLALLTLTSLCSVSALAGSNDPAASDPFIDAEPHPEHSFTEWAYHSDTEHVRSCSCGRIEYADHVWNDGEENSEGTATVYSCTACDATYSEELVQPNPTVIYGDTDNDGTVTLADAVLLNRYLANFDYDSGTSSVTIAAGGDTNGDGNVTLADAVLLNSYLANYNYDVGGSTVILGPKQ